MSWSFLEFFNSSLLLPEKKIYQGLNMTQSTLSDLAPATFPSLSPSQLCWHLQMSGYALNSHPFLDFAWLLCLLLLVSEELSLSRSAFSPGPGLSLFFGALVVPLRTLIAASLNFTVGIRLPVELFHWIVRCLWTGLCSYLLLSF